MQRSLPKKRNPADTEIRELRTRQRRAGNHINVDEIKDARARCAAAINRGE